jgi:4-hydroxy-2-oxoheptanedioate aldolase
MPAIENPTKRILSSGGLSVGIGVRSLRGIEVARAMKTAGFDFLFIDLEHGTTSIETASAISIAALDAGITPIVRVPHMELKMASRCLDGGALGIVVPHVDTPDEAEAVVAALRFPPLGRRSIGGGYPQFGFAPVPAMEAVAALNEATLVIVMIETPTAVANVEKIAAVPGIDGLLLGTNDLCLELGIPGKLDSPQIVAAIDAVVGACRKHGKWPALGGVYSRELLQPYLARGMRMALAGNDLALFISAATAQATFVRSCAIDK